jgi:hypothetical protein
MDNSGRFIASITAAAMLSLGFAAPVAAQQAATQVYLPAKAAAAAPDVARTEADSTRVIDQVTAEANARTKAGQPAEDVEAWMAEQLARAGMTVESAPPSWDVYGSAKWEQENPGADSADNREPNQDGIATIDRFNSRNPVDGRYEQTEEKEDPERSDETDSPETNADGQDGRGRTRNTASAGSAGGFFVYADAGRSREKPAAAGEAAVRLRAAEAGGERPAVGGTAHHAPGLDSDLRGRPGEPAAAPRSQAAGADTD